MTHVILVDLALVILLSLSAAFYMLLSWPRSRDDDDDQVNHLNEVSESGREPRLIVY
ncbi:hypothetical protein J4573_01180 [Actinomadura barringtoniae]|uniref:Uncharacterized protein n=1 Tax=Actinomadura barringtoniae TaxID=1427535 RepID=A0A939P5R2_9ACTN|nr:hypothetical protein [Actinomadura barringtoniae]MBO2445693.1 hypothetical protein [Actinomadura barringtoniae]